MCRVDTAEFAVSVPHPVKINKMGSKLIRMNFLTSFFITLYNTPLWAIELLLFAGLGNDGEPHQDLLFYRRETSPNGPLKGSFFDCYTG